MMSPTRFHTLAATLLVVLAAPVILHGQPADEAADSTLANMARVRPVDKDARRILELGLRASPTLARMAADLERTNLVVSVQTCPLARGINGDARVLAAVGGVRHVRIRLSVPRATSDLIIVLGHELRHALEFTAMPDVTDGESLVRAYSSLGAAQVRKGCYETEAALEAGRAVAAELSQRAR